MAPPTFIAEVSSNHNGDLERCLEFVRVAAELGCDGIKFQLFSIDKLFASIALQVKPELNARRTWELPISYLPAIKRACIKHNLLLGCTPFDIANIEPLVNYGVDFIKIASYSLLDWRLLRACANANRRLVISTGMGTREEIGSALDVIHRYKCDVTLLHCISQYPTPPESCNLAYINNLRSSFGVKAGWSDHSRTPSVIYLASILYDASMVEFHLDLDGEGAEYGQGHCWLPAEIGPVIEGCKRQRLIGGTGRKDHFSLAEHEERLWRADPSDGLRPVMSLRKELNK